MGAVVVDKLLKKPLLHVHDGMIVNSIVFLDDNGIKWEMTVDTDGRVVTTKIIELDPGNPTGLLLTLTYP